MSVTTTPKTIQIVYHLLSESVGFRLELKEFKCQTRTPYAVTHFYQSGKNLIHKSYKFETIEDAQAKFTKIRNARWMKYAEMSSLEVLPVVDPFTIRVEMRK